MNVRDDAAVETAAAGATAVKVKLLAAGDEGCTTDVVGEIPHEILEGAAAIAVLAFKPATKSSRRPHCDASWSHERIP